VLRRVGLAALVVVMVVGIGFATEGTARAEPGYARDARMTAPGVRVSTGSTVHAERRVPFDRGWAPACITACGGWVRLLSSALVVAGSEAAPARSRSRAPPI
jgi:hypothetical protein